MSIVLQLNGAGILAYDNMDAWDELYKAIVKEIEGRYPHICPKCGYKCYIDGMNNIDHMIGGYDDCR